VTFLSYIRLTKPVGDAVAATVVREVIDVTDA